MRHSPKPGSDATCAAMRLGCVGGAVRRAWTAALHGPRCCTQRPEAGDRLDAGRWASRDAVQEEAPGGAVVGGTVYGESHLLHGSGITLKGGRRRHQSGAVLQPQGFRSYREQGHTASFRVGERHRHVAAGVARADRKEGLRTTRERLSAGTRCRGQRKASVACRPGDDVQAPTVQRGRPLPHRYDWVSPRVAGRGSWKAARVRPGCLWEAGWP